MYPHIITIIHKVSDAQSDSYIAYTINGVYIESGITLSKSGTVFDVSGNVIISVNNANTLNFGNTWTASTGDRVVEGEYQLPSGFKFADIPDAYVIDGVDKQLAGTDLDSIVLRCK